MRIQIRTLKSEKFEIEVEDDNTVNDLKLKIQNDLKLGAADMMNLIHHGKVLTNEQSVLEIGFEENDFVVLMLKKSRPMSNASSNSEPQGTAPRLLFSCSTTSETDRISENPSAGTSAGWSIQPHCGSAVSAEVSSEEAGRELNVLVLGDEKEEAISNLMQMGFPEADVRGAMNAAFNNPQRAAEYLLTGIPENLMVQRHYQGQSAPQKNDTVSFDITVDRDPPAEGNSVRPRGDGSED